MRKHVKKKIALVSIICLLCLFCSIGKEEYYCTLCYNKSTAYVFNPFFLFKHSCAINRNIKSTRLGEMLNGRLIMDKHRWIAYDRNSIFIVVLNLITGARPHGIYCSQRKIIDSLENDVYFIKLKTIASYDINLARKIATKMVTPSKYVQWKKQRDKFAAFNLKELPYNKKVLEEIQQEYSE